MIVRLSKHACFYSQWGKTDSEVVIQLDKDERKPLIFLHWVKKKHNFQPNNYSSGPNEHAHTPIYSHKEILPTCVFSPNKI